MDKFNLDVKQMDYISQDNKKILNPKLVLKQISLENKNKQTYLTFLSLMNFYG